MTSFYGDCRAGSQTHAVPGQHDRLSRAVTVHAVGEHASVFGVAASRDASQRVSVHCCVRGMHRASPAQCSMACSSPNCQVQRYAPDSSNPNCFVVFADDCTTRAAWYGRMEMSSFTCINPSHSTLFVDWSGTFLMASVPAHLP